MSTESNLQKIHIFPSEESYEQNKGNVGIDDIAFLPDVADERYLQLSGGTLTGALTLNGEPTEDLQAATKQYVDNLVGTINTTLDTINGEVV